MNIVQARFLFALALISGILVCIQRPVTDHFLPILLGLLTGGLSIFAFPKKDKQ